MITPTSVLPYMLHVGDPEDELDAQVRAAMGSPVNESFSERESSGRRRPRTHAAYDRPSAPRRGW